MELYTNTVLLIVRTILLFLLLFEFFKLIFSKGKRVKTARAKFMYKFTYPIFWIYIIIFLGLTIFINNNYLMKYVDKNTLTTLRESIKLGWAAFIIEIFAQAGFTIGLAVIVSFLYLFFRIEI
jgi:hypothetical protein